MQNLDIKYVYSTPGFVNLHEMFLKNLTFDFGVRFRIYLKGLELKDDLFRFFLEACFASYITLHKKF